METGLDMHSVLDAVVETVVNRIDAKLAQQRRDLLIALRETELSNLPLTINSLLDTLKRQHRNMYGDRPYGLEMQLVLSMLPQLSKSVAAMNESVTRMAACDPALRLEG